MTDKILLIENEEHLRGLYQIELEEEGYNVLVAGNGHEALTRLHREPVDLVVLDLKLPDGSGLEYLQEVLQLQRDVKVVINTAYPTYKLDFHTWAADAFLVKSSDLNELKRTIAGLLHSERN
ncbi:MAG: response regulator [bacterium]